MLKLSSALQFCDRTFNDFRYYVDVYLKVIVIICAFCLLRHFVAFAGEMDAVLPQFIAAIIIATLGVFVSMRDLPRSSRILLRGVCVAMGGYVLALWQGFSTDGLSESVTIFLSVGRWMAILCSVIAMFRPTFAIPLMVYVSLHKFVVARSTGIAVSVTDYTPLIEIGLLLAIGGFFFAALERAGTPKFVYYSEPARVEDRLPPLTVLTFFAIAVHFGNYFWSAIAKYSLDGGVLSWLLDNDTANLYLIAQEMGMLPFSHLEGLASSAYVVLSNTVLLVNLLTLVSQTLAVILIHRVRWIIWTMIFYDLMHVAIYFVSGIFFWKWILLNLAIIFAMRAERHRVLPRLVRMAGSIAVMTGIIVFWTAKLGWYDTPTLNKAYFEVVTTDGQVYEVPTNFFLSASVTFAQMRVAGPFYGHFPIGTYGTTHSNDTRGKAERCRLDLKSAKSSLAVNGALGTQQSLSLERYIKTHHAFVLDTVDQTGRLSYNWYPHHIFSNPWEFEAFSRLDTRDIVDYRYVVESLCLGFKNGRFTKSIQARSEHVFPVR